MKIIGKAKDSFILQASENEVANLVGHYSHWDVRLETGDEINVAKMYHQLRSLSVLRTEIESTKETLLEMAKSLEVVLPVTFNVEKVIPDNKL